MENSADATTYSADADGDISSVQDRGSDVALQRMDTSMDSSLAQYDYSIVRLLSHLVTCHEANFVSGRQYVAGAAQEVHRRYERCADVGCRKRERFEIGWG